MTIQKENTRETPSPGKNRLAKEASPYLRQHAGNPVDWYPWGVEAFARAQAENKPIFLSIGYSTCHWCHVMEEESFEDDRVARLLRQDFIAIKVDREERPDVDNIHMAAVQGLTGSGGWPLSIFLTPDGKPFFGGTYFPREDRHGRIGFTSLLTQIAEMWREQGDKLRRNGDQLADQVKGLLQQQAPSPLTLKNLEKAFAQMEGLFDQPAGGFGGAPKFPRSHALSFLLRYGKRTGDERALAMVRGTLDRIEQGGIHDHLGGGVHRYATDRDWNQPHFEKMLYDQALLARCCLETFQVTGDGNHARMARDIFFYVLRDLQAPAGGFHTAEDADSQGEEGKFYRWTREEILRHLGATYGAWFCRIYGVTEAGNYKDEATGRRTGDNVLHLAGDRASLAAAEKMKPHEFSARLHRLGDKLRLLREGRPRPGLDGKILTDWNGLMISALARGGQVLQEPAYLAAARRAAAFCRDKMFRQGRLYHCHVQGKVSVPGFLDDYAFFLFGLVELYECTLEVEWLELAKRVAGEMGRLFWDNQDGGFFFVGADGEKLFARTKEIYDGALPSGNSIATLALFRLGAILRDEKLIALAEENLRFFSSALATYPVGYPAMLMALDFYLGPRQEVVLAGARDDREMGAMRLVLANRFLPGTVVSLYPAVEDRARVEALIPGIKAQVTKSGTAAFMCRDQACSAPVHRAVELGKEL